MLAEKRAALRRHICVEAGRLFEVLDVDVDNFAAEHVEVEVILVISWGGQKWSVYEGILERAEE